MKCIVFLLVFLIGLSGLKAQNLQYEITISGVKVGELKVSRQKNEGNETISASSEVVYQVLSKTELEYYYEAVFTNGYLEKVFLNIARMEN